MPNIIRTGVRGYVIETDKASQSGCCCEYGNFKALGGPGDGQYPTTTPPLYWFNGYVFDVEAAVIWDVVEHPVSGAPVATNVRAQ